MAEITIANARDIPLPSEWPAWFVYVGRENKSRGLKASPLANPFVIGQPFARIRETSYGGEYSTGPINRETSIALFRSRLDGDIADGVTWVRACQEIQRLKSLLAKYRKLTLVCWCAPKRCHAEVIREKLLEIMNKEAAA
jgi:hypothetical protein